MPTTEARQHARALTGCALAAALALSGCGGGSSTSAAKKGGISFNGKSATIEMGSPIAAAGHRTIPARYTCDGKDIPPLIGWNALPPGTQELALFLIGFKNNGTLSVRWAVTGIAPTVHVLPAGKLPPGAILGRNNLGSTHYSLCPAKGSVESFLFILYALPRTVKVNKGFVGGELLSKISAPDYPAPFGAFVTTYARA